MSYELRFQDPAAATTRYLYEEIVAQLLDPGVTEIEAVFAFASYHGVLGLTQDPAFQDFIRRGTFRLLVGLDAVTDRRALEVLRDAEAAHHPRFEVKVFKNEQPGLFHPKIVRSFIAGGSGCLVVGSGNLTPGGLRGNIEAYSVLRYEPDSAPDQSAWDTFLLEHEAEITSIDADALDRGERNGQQARLGRRLARRSRRPRRDLRVRPEAVLEEITGEAEVPISVEEASPQPAPTDRMLVAEVPRAGGRWHQVHFNEPAVRDYFRARPGTPDRVYMFRREPSGAVRAEPARPVVFSSANVNHRIEFGAHAGEGYPPDGPPILVVRELGLRTHIYVMLFPGESGYTEMAGLLAAEPKIGRGVPRVITNRALVEAAWPYLPI
jgi:hypothetical protein